MRKSNVANIITSLRIVGAAALFFFKLKSIHFLVIYSLCGLSDVLDGTVARAMHIQGDDGARLDSIADLIFYCVMLIKVIPALWGNVSAFVWIFAGVVIALRCAAYITAAAKYRLFASVHTYLNKLTGLAVFILPYLMAVTERHTLICITVCSIGFAASLEELLIHIVSENYSQSNKMLITAIKNR